MGQNTKLSNLSKELKNFADERDWQQFHTPKNLSMALAVEAAEIMELFQWLTPSESESLSVDKKNNLADELGDTLIYLIRLSDMTGIDLIKAAETKLAKNRDKYPAEKVKGSAKKYTEYFKGG